MYFKLVLYFKLNYTSTENKHTLPHTFLKVMSRAHFISVFKPHRFIYGELLLLALLLQQ